MKRCHRTKIEVQREAKSWVRPNDKGKEQTHEQHTLQSISLAMQSMKCTSLNIITEPTQEPSISTMKRGCQQDNFFEEKGWPQ